MSREWGKTKSGCTNNGHHSPLTTHEPNVTEPLVYLNGRMLPASEARLAIYDTGIVQGATVTEQIRTFHKRPYKLEEHQDRLWYSLRSARIDIGLQRGELSAISQELVAHHAGLLDAGSELGLIQFVTAGEYAAFAGLHNDCLVTIGLARMSGTRCERRTLRRWRRKPRCA